MNGVGAAGAISGQAYGPMTQIIENSAATLARLNKLTEQSSTGLIAQSLSVRVSIRKTLSGLTWSW